MANASEELMQKVINEINRKPDVGRVWLTTSDPRTSSPRMPRVSMFRAPIEQYTETLPRRWWQLKAATRIRIRRVQPQTINCRCVISGSWL